MLAAGTSLGKVAFYKYYRVEKDEEHNWHVQYVATVSGPAKMGRSVLSSGPAKMGSSIPNGPPKWAGQSVRELAKMGRSVR